MHTSRFRRIAGLLFACGLIALLIVACGQGQQTGDTGDTGDAGDTTEQQAEPTAAEAAPEPTATQEEAMDSGDTGEQAASMPGEGTTVDIARATWDTGWFQAKVYRVLLEELGYEVSDPATLDNPAAYLSIARGEVDFWANGWFPLHNTFIESDQVKNAGGVELVGYQVENGALQGYLIDKKTVEEEGIDNLGMLTDPEVAAMFDGDGNGKADLFGCPPGWGCELVIEHHLDAYGLRDTVEHIQGAYAANMTEAISRYEDGEPILFYTWTPNWTVNLLVPGEDVLWIGVPEPNLPEEQKELEDQTTVAGVNGCVADPCPMGWPANDIRVAANPEFLSNNPAAKALFEQVQIPLSDIAAQNAKMQDGEDSEEDIRRHAEEWVDANRDQVDQWLEEARAAASE